EQEMSKFRLWRMVALLVVIFGVLTSVFWGSRIARLYSLAARYPGGVTSEDLEEIYTEKEGPPHLRNYYYYRARKFPFDRIPAGARLKAIRDLAKGFHATIDQTFPWQPLGPLSLKGGQILSTGGANGTPFTGQRDFTSGRATAITFDPHNGNTIYVGAAQGG